MTLIEFVEWLGNLNILAVVALWWGMCVVSGFVGKAWRRAVREMRREARTNSHD